MDDPVAREQTDGILVEILDELRGLRSDVAKLHRPQGRHALAKVGVQAPREAAKAAKGTKK